MVVPVNSMDRDRDKIVNVLEKRVRNLEDLVKRLEDNNKNLEAAVYSIKMEIDCTNC